MLGVLFDHVFAVFAHWDTITSPCLDMEATLFCLKSVSEEIPSDENQHIAKLFGPEILGRLPSQNNARLQNTALSLIGKFDIEGGKKKVGCAVLTQVLYFCTNII
jgi:hypothetical protein